MEAAAQKNREQLITMTTGGNVHRQADVLLQLVDRGVVGIALVPCYDYSHGYQLRYLHKANVPLVLLHRGVPDVAAPVIDIPFREVSALAGRELGSAGHKHVAAFLGLHSEVTQLYLDGLRDGLRLHGVELNDSFVMWADTMLIGHEDCSRHADKTEAALNEMLSRSDRPTAVFVSFDRLAVMVYLAAINRGLRVPEDLSIVTFGDSRRSGAILPGMATISVDEYQAGGKAYELLAAMNSGEQALECSDNFTMAVSFDPAETFAARAD
jgi:LacI family transcriptional regulator